MATEQENHTEIEKTEHTNENKKRKVNKKKYVISEVQLLEEGELNSHLLELQKKVILTVLEIVKTETSSVFQGTPFEYFLRLNPSKGRITEFMKTLQVPKDRLRDVDNVYISLLDLFNTIYEKLMQIDTKLQPKKLIQNIESQVLLTLFPTGDSEYEQNILSVIKQTRTLFESKSKQKSSDTENQEEPTTVKEDK